ncbi:hypothetical protein [Glacieibacterium sp.]|uniref:hypothetical protein n=1 Tax=Glacieibacterium sp. TaxID=2860237 RepID=UPI003AFFBDAF
MRRFLPIFITLPLLACHAESTTKSTAADHGLKIDANGFKASLDIPGMALGGKDFDISGMKLYPGSEVHGMKVTAHDKDGAKQGTVTVSFTSPAPPEKVLTEAETEAKANDWTMTRSGDTLNGINDDGDTMTYTVTSSGSASTGTIILTDKD